MLDWSLSMLVMVLWIIFIGVVGGGALVVLVVDLFESFRDLVRAAIQAYWRLRNFYPWQRFLQATPAVQQQLFLAEIRPLCYEQLKKFPSRFSRQTKLQQIIPELPPQFLEDLFFQSTFEEIFPKTDDIDTQEFMIDLYLGFSGSDYYSWRAYKIHRWQSNLKFMWLWQDYFQSDRFLKHVEDWQFQQWVQRKKI